MRIFENNADGWGDKINFVDENNVLVGFDYSQSCCENFGYFFSKKIPASQEKDEITVDPDGYSFDPSFCESSHENGEYSEGGQVAFKLLNAEGDVIFLNLYNHHNGYYSHGFTCKVGDKTLHEGSV